MHLWTSIFQVSIFTGKSRRRCFKRFNRLFVCQTSCFDAWKYNWNVEYWHGSQGSQCWSSNYFRLCYKWETSGLRSQWRYSWRFVQVHTELTTFLRNIISCCMYVYLFWWTVKSYELWGRPLMMSAPFHDFFHRPSSMAAVLYFFPNFNIRALIMTFLM